MRESQRKRVKFVEGDNFLLFDSPVGHVVLVMVCSSWRQSLGIQGKDT